MFPMRGVVKDGVIVPSSPLPEGAEVEIRLAETQTVIVEMNANAQTEFEAWQQANAEALGSVGKAVETEQPPQT